MKAPKQHLASVILSTLATLYLVLVGMEFLKPGLVSNVIDLSILLLALIVYVICGSALKIFPQQKQQPNISKKITFTVPVVAGILGILILGVKLSSLGELGWVAATVGAVVIAVLTYMHLKEM